MSAVSSFALGQSTPAHPRRRHRHGALLALLCAAASGGLVATAQASTTIAEFRVTQPSTGLVDLNMALPGQSFTLQTNNDWDHITFNFYSRDTGEAAAAGHLYLFDAPYLGQFGELNADSPGLLGIGGAAGGVYTFDALLTLHAHTQYFVYADVSTRDIGGDNGIEYTGGDASPRYAGGNYYAGIPAAANGSLASSFLLNRFFASPGNDAAFRVTGVAAVPEPGTLSQLFSGLGVLGCIALIPRKKS